MNEEKLYEGVDLGGEREIRPVLSIAGSDPIGGAGIQADIKTISAWGHYAMTALTAVTVQNTMGVKGWEAVSAEMLKGQIDAVFRDIPPASVKIGMVGNAVSTAVIGERLRAHKAKNIVCDTVMVAASGGKLSDDSSVSAMIREIFPIADIITPNIPEAEVLCNMQIHDLSDMKTAAKKLSEMTPGAVLVKGGHLTGEYAEDILFYKGETEILSCPRIDNPNTHGTGCTLSSAIACGLAEGCGLPDAVRYAKSYMGRVIGKNFKMGQGKGSLWHFE
ncbi:MAG: bifunctional hydroxymethylpyrimidine kinase/phosphomethylpyrimidine kinase [Ruminococcus sp.]|nr:bifunctional hydroxymethylpyrimidine kinase/phosphomethylpyrimidine kinase [Ruminococcus sp.]